MTSDRTLRSRVTGNGHARFWIGGGGSNLVTDHTHTINKRLETLIKATRYIHINANINNKLLTINKRLETLIKITQNLSQVIISQKR